MKSNESDQIFDDISAPRPRRSFPTYLIFKEKNNFSLSNRHQTFRTERAHEYCNLVGPEVSTRSESRDIIGKSVKSAQIH